MVLTLHGGLWKAAVGAVRQSTEDNHADEPETLC